MVAACAHSLKRAWSTPTKRTRPELGESASTRTVPADWAADGRLGRTDLHSPSTESGTGVTSTLSGGKTTTRPLQRRCSASQYFPVPALVGESGSGIDIKTRVHEGHPVLCETEPHLSHRIDARRPGRPFAAGDDRVSRRIEHLP